MINDEDEDYLICTEDEEQNLLECEKESLEEPEQVVIETENVEGLLSPPFGETDLTQPSNSNPLEIPLSINEFVFISYCLMFISHS